MKYKVYMSHTLGGPVRFVSEHDHEDEAERKRMDVEDSMFDAWIVEEE